MSRRRKFLKTVSAVGLGIGFNSSSLQAKSQQNLEELFLHHVFFWLKDPENKANRKKFEKGLKELA